MEAETIGAFEQFLKWGPIGLAGMMLVLVILGLSLGATNPSKERTLKTFMFVGAGCFVAALLFQFLTGNDRHKIVLTVLPNDIDGGNFPPPKISMNGLEVDRDADDVFVSETTSMLIDVSRAVGLFEEKIAQANSATQRATEAAAELQKATTEVSALEAQISEQSEELQSAKLSIERQDEALRAALQDAERLSGQISDLKAVASANTPVPPAAIQSIERGVIDLNRGLGRGLILP